MNPITTKQSTFIKSLRAERGLTDALDFSLMTSKDASALITNLLATPVAGSAVEEGMYRKGDAIFRVQKSLGNGNFYAKRLDVIEMKFVYEPGAIKTLKGADKMTLAEAKAFGVETGFCCVCARFLTDQKSVAEGIGPVCAKSV